jgi:hypothetical protein
VRREVRDLLPSAQMIAAQAVSEQQRWSAAGDFIVELAEWPLQLSGRALHGVL